MNERLSLRDIVRLGTPRPGLAREVNRWRRANLPHLARSARTVLPGRLAGAVQLESATYLKVFRGDGSVEDLGLASMRVVTTAGVGYIVDAFQNLVEPENMKFHGFGTGTGAEAVGDTALGTEFTTQYATDNNRPTGTLAEGASGNIFRTVGLFVPDSGGTLAVTEHGIFSQVTTGGGVLLDRSQFAAVNLIPTNGDSLQVTYEITFPSGG